MEEKQIPFKESMWINTKTRNKSELMSALIHKAIICFGWVIDKHTVHFNPGFDNREEGDKRIFSTQAFFTVKEIK
jgi:hypothetical protein